MQVQIQRGSPLRQSELELPENLGTMEGGEILELDEALEADRSGFKCPLCHLLHVIFRQLLNLPEPWSPHLQNGDTTSYFME